MYVHAYVHTQLNMHQGGPGLVCATLFSQFFHNESVNMRRVCTAGIHTCTHTYVRLCAYMHTYVCKDMYAHAHICKDMYVHAHICKDMCVHAHICKDMYVHAHICKDMYVHTHLYLHLCTVYVHIDVRVWLCVCIFCQFRKLAHFPKNIISCK